MKYENKVTVLTHLFISKALEKLRYRKLIAEVFTS